MDMDPTDIRIELMRAGTSQAELARDLGVHHTTVFRVIEGTTVSHRIRAAIAEAIRMDVRRIWPSTYVLHGGPRRPGRPGGGRAEKTGSA